MPTLVRNRLSLGTGQRDDPRHARDASEQSRAMTRETQECRQTGRHEEGGERSERGRAGEGGRAERAGEGEGGQSSYPGLTWQVGDLNSAIVCRCRGEQRSRCAGWGAS